jgi:hypothetical protein
LGLVTDSDFAGASLAGIAACKPNRQVTAHLGVQSLMAKSLIEVALFPIPGMVAFPGTIVPLHVFEPRYRQMVTDVVEQDRMIAVCHTKKDIRPAKDGQSMQDALKNDQATYRPVEVFSAGICEIIDTTADGRV